MFEKQNFITKAIIVLLSWFPIIGVPLILSFAYSAYDSRKKMFKYLNKAGKELNSDSLLSFAKNWERIQMLLIVIAFQQAIMCGGIIYYMFLD